MDIALPLVAAWLAGGILGLERTFHGRAAGFRTHALVSLAAAAVMTASHLAGLDGPGDAGRLAQGLITGIGFLGAGVIFKEGVNVQGLTTAATVWTTSAIGLVFGTGDYWLGAAATGLALITLIILRWLESCLPTQVYARAILRFEVGKAPSETDLLAYLAGKGASLRDLGHARIRQGEMIEFRGMISAQRPAFAALAADLRDQAGLVEFDLDRVSK